MTMTEFVLLWNQYNKSIFRIPQIHIDQISR